MRRLLAVVLFGGFTCAFGGAPLHDVISLRTLEIRSCEGVTPENVAQVSGFVAAPGRSSRSRGKPSVIAEAVPGYVIEALVKRQRDISPTEDIGWKESDDAATFFYGSTQPDVCEEFETGAIVSVLVDQKPGCDTYPPHGLCAFDSPIKLVTDEPWLKELWAKYGE